MGEYWNQAHVKAYFRAPDVSPTFKTLFSQLQPHKKQLYLEVGVGSGRHLLYAQQQLKNSGEFVASDIITNDLQHALHRNIEVIQADMRDCPIKSGSTGLVISWRVLHQLTERDRIDAIDELRRITTDGSNILIAVRSTEDFWNKRGISIEPNTYVLDSQNNMPYSFNFNPTLGAKSWHFSSSPELYKLLEGHGFDSIKITPFLEKAESAHSHNNLQNTYWALSARRTGDAHQWTGIQFNR